MYLLCTYQWFAPGWWGRAAQGELDARGLGFWHPQQSPGWEIWFDCHLEKLRGSGNEWRVVGHLGKYPEFIWVSFPCLIGEIRKLGGDHLSTSIICSLEECCNKLVVSANHLVEHTMLGLWSPGVGIWLIMETQGWRNWYLKTWKGQISSGLPKPPILGQTIDRCSNQAGGLYGRNLIKVVSTDRTQWGLYTWMTSRFSHTDRPCLVNKMFIIFVWK